ncbi:LemA family protein [Sphingomonas sp.]|uniref:LemA family protein n=1 Tax=Sphingomonas sp. TaxID=28214 RepID=UPI00286C6C6D|nr:LemA family protein [Sphingomonas sp.]
MLTLLIIIAIIVLVGLFGVATYNRLVRLRALVKEAFSGITVQLRRRADLLPNLVETVKGYASHEKSTFEAITAARASMAGGGGVAATAAADAQMTGLIGRLFAVAEAYPELKASANFQQLQSEISAIETELQSARRYYNATARDLNTRAQSFPDMLFAGPLGIAQEEYYKDEDPAIQTTPKIDFTPAA